ncbi:PIN domain-containing protein [Rubrivirga sp. S365]|uniref:PIN domain-containing protein n=1 Tax=Rubrivirga sp. S365 TaxID=3076080 RepID=UPI0028C976CF|nr:PIN domain-containing protein [Rubrivirga sp. S365]MDT7856019.1 PIN domain-containing protein [Rubrivirga sp. S365]
MSRPPQIVIDTNVVVAAQRSGCGASSLLLSLIGTGAFDIHLSVPLAFEYEAVLTRQRKEIGLSRRDVDDIVDSLCALAVPHRIYFLWRPYLRDPDDEHVLELAVAAGCDYVVTYNRTDFAGAERFGVSVADPKELLREIGAIP